MNGGRDWDIAVDGGTLRVVEWGPPDPPTEPVVLAVHGITANHRAWEPVAALLTGRRVLAPDLRGRGRSAALPGPYGLAQYADDLVAVLDATGVEQATVVGHSMGGFVAAALLARAPERVGRLLLVDGGLPLVAPDAAPQRTPASVLGPALDRLSMTFPDRDAYREFWKVHPAFADDWSAAVERYVDYDLTGDPGALRSSVRRDAVEADFADQLGGQTMVDAAAALREAEFSFLRAPRGLQNELPGLYPPDAMRAAAPQYPRMLVSEVEGVNHYTILLSDRGAAAVVGALTSPPGAVHQARSALASGDTP